MSVDLDIFELSKFPGFKNKEIKYVQYVIFSCSWVSAVSRNIPPFAKEHQQYYNGNFHSLLIRYGIIVEFREIMIIVEPAVYNSQVVNKN